MDRDQDIPATYSNGALRPDEPLHLPENSRVRVSIRRVEATPEQEAKARERLSEILRKGAVRLGGWRPTRDEMHERH